MGRFGKSVQHFFNVIKRFVKCFHHVFDNKLLSQIVFVSFVFVFRKKNIFVGMLLCKSVKICIGLKKDLFGCFRIEEIRDKDNETGLMEGG